eukprot:GHVR01079089.1.p1 GENE.GHVR01079089.1~~GHVR01079089.1.p1  ORF type:complete len:170 (+),score=16.80 GHVR01079089.1:55-564(+)
MPMLNKSKLAAVAVSVVLQLNGGIAYARSAGYSTPTSTNMSPLVDPANEKIYVPLFGIYTQTTIIQMGSPPKEYMMAFNLMSTESWVNTKYSPAKNDKELNEKSILKQSPVEVHHLYDPYESSTSVSDSTSLRPDLYYEAANIQGVDIKQFPFIGKELAPKWPSFDGFV